MARAGTPGVVQFKRLHSNKGSATPQWWRSRATRPSPRLPFLQLTAHSAPARTPSGSPNATTRQVTLQHGPPHSTSAHPLPAPAASTAPAAAACGAPGDGPTPRSYFAPGRSGPHSP
eukprot:1159398-Pelagomonas_calceolata.AAC.10